MFNQTQLKKFPTMGITMGIVSHPAMEDYSKLAGHTSPAFSKVYFLLCPPLSVYATA